MADCQSTDDKYYKTQKTTRAKERLKGLWGPCSSICILNKTNLLDVSEGVPNYTAMYDYFSGVLSKDPKFQIVIPHILAQGLKSLNDTIDTYGGIPPDPRQLCKYWGEQILNDLTTAIFRQCPSSLSSMFLFVLFCPDSKD